MSESVTPGVGVMLGKGAELRCNGTTWKISAPNQDAAERLEKIVKAQSLLAVEALASVLPPDAYSRAYDRALRSLSQYDTWEEGWQAAVFSRPHYFLWSLLQDAHPNVTEEQVQEILTESPEGVAAAYAQVMPDFFRLLADKKVEKVPKKRREEARQTVLAQLNPVLAALVEQLGRIPASETASALPT